LDKFIAVFRFTLYAITNRVITETTHVITGKNHVITEKPLQKVILQAPRDERLMKKEKISI
jgi:hypothetical protein